MSEKPLLLSSAKSGVLVGRPRHRALVRTVVLAVGVVAVLAGLADVTARAARAVLGEDALRDALAPAAAEGRTLTTTSLPATEVPARLRVAALGIDARVERVGLKSGAMSAPKSFDNVGWYEKGSMPGGAGNAVFAGHVNNARTQSGVFENLSKIKLGDYVTVEGEDGKTLVYRVKEIAQYPWDQAPAPAIFATEGPSQLVLITCEGEWLHTERTFDKRLVVIARLAY